MTISFSTLFGRLGTAINALNVLNTARGSTIPAEVEDFLDTVASGSPELRGTVDGVPPGLLGWQDAGDSLAEAVAQAAQNVLIRMVFEDNPQAALSLDASLNELIRQMVANSQSVDGTTPSATVGFSGDGDGTCVVSVKRPDGRLAENILAESIRVECVSGSQTATALFTATSPLTREKLSHLWPAGSGINVTLTANDAASSQNLLLNGDMDDDDDRANTPNDWIVAVGTIGTTVKMTIIEQQTIEIASDPSSGFYTLTWAGGALFGTQTTAPIAWDAESSAVQAALRQLYGLENVTVSSTGTSPNFTHTVVFTGRGGNLAELTSTNNFDAGTITHATTVAGTASVYAGAKALEMDADGSQATEIRSLLRGGDRVQTAVQPLSQYAFCGWFLVDTFPAAGVITVDLHDGASVINDEAGTANSFTIDPQAAGDLTEGSFVPISGVFRTPADLPPTVYLRIRQSTAISSGTSIFIDHCSLAQMTELYADGPHAAIFSGATPFVAGNAELTAGDLFTLAVATDGAGLVQRGVDRLFDMTTKRLLLPSLFDTNETIADSVIG